MNKKLTALLMAGLAAQANAADAAVTNLRVYDDSVPAEEYEDSEFCEIEYSTETWLHDEDEYPEHSYKPSEPKTEYP